MLVSIKLCSQHTNRSVQCMCCERAFRESSCRIRFCHRGPCHRRRRRRRLGPWTTSTARRRRSRPLPPPPPPPPPRSLDDEYGHAPPLPAAARVWIFEWRLRSSLRANRRPHTSHANGFSPVWVRWWSVAAGSSRSLSH